MKAYKKQQMNYQQAKPLPYQCFKPKKLAVKLPTFQFKHPCAPPGVTYHPLPPRIINGQIDESACYQIPNTQQQQQCFSQSFANIQKSKQFSKQPIMVNKARDNNWKKYETNDQ